MPFKHSKKHIEFESLVTAASNKSKVKKTKSRFWGDSFTWGVFIMVFMVLCFVFFSGGGKTKTKKSHLTTVRVSSDNTELADNLARLSQMEQALQKPFTPMTFSRQANQRSKAYLARQNAPTRMYSQDQRSSANGKSVHSGSAILSGHSVFTQFANQPYATGSVSAKQIAHPRYTVASGEFVHAILETAISSDLPGQIRAVVSQPVYAYVGQRPLIPAGSRLIGQYSASVFKGQNRVFAIWNRVILPDGVSVQLNSSGTDSIGRAGMRAGRVDRHFFAQFAQAALLSIIGVGAATTGVSSGDQYNSASQYRMALAQSFQQTSSNVMRNGVNRNPTLHIDQGEKINIFVARDLDFYSALRWRAM